MNSNNVEIEQEYFDKMNSIASAVIPVPKIEKTPVELAQYYYDLGEFYYSIGKPHKGDMHFATAREQLKSK